MRVVIDKRPQGALAAVAEKVEYWTQEGHKTLYLVVSFLPVPQPQGAAPVDRAIEFFMPLGQSGESQQWITSSMRRLSLAARGGFLERALRDMRKVAWDRGPVRLGQYIKQDGTKVPLRHDSEVAAIAYALQQIIAQRQECAVAQPAHGAATVGLGLDTPSAVPTMAGKKCAECGAYSVIRKDGCDYCTQCGHVGTCG
jgi:ribonucleoside-diphosphate reductase alpha chain